MKMANYMVHFRQLILFFTVRQNYLASKKEKNNNNNNICTVYGESVLADRTVRKGFTKFRVGDCILIR